MNGWKWRLLGMVLLLALQPCALRIALAQDQKTVAVDPNAAFEGRTVNKVEIAARPSEDLEKLRGLIQQDGFSVGRFVGAAVHLLIELD